MKCYYHSDREPVGACVSCGQLICSECKVTLGGRIYCNPCADERFSRPPEGLNWFQRHLNWTWVLVYLAWIPLNASDELVPQIIGAILLLLVSGWVVKRKGRSLWWVLLTPLFSPLWLKNKRTIRKELPRQALLCNDSPYCQLTVTTNEARSGTKRMLIRKDRRLEVTIPAGVSNGSVVRLTGALQVTDDIDGDIFIRVKETKDRQTLFRNLGFWSLLLCIPGVFVYYSTLPNILFFISAGVLGTIQLKRHFSKLAVAGVTIAALSLILWVATEVHLELIPHSPAHIYRSYDIREIGGNRRPVELINNPDARDPSWEQLLAFIRADSTDTRKYIDTFYWGYVCADYARDVHNNAEEAGIRAAWVGVEFEEGGWGHALNAFMTIDRGLVFVDCTRVDTIAYVKTGEELGYIDLDLAISPEYSFYEEHKHMWPYSPMGTVKDLQIHWGPELGPDA